MAHVLLWKRHPRSQNNYFPALIPIIAAVVGGIGLGVGIESLTSTPKAPSTPPLPSIDTSGSTAQSAQTQQRQDALRAGGNTNVTGGSGIVLGSNVNSVTLIGSS